MHQKQIALAAILIALGACSPKDAGQPAGTAAAPPPASVDVQPAPAPQATGDGPPTINGLYVAKDACPGEGCYLTGRIKAYEPADLYDKAGAGAVVTGKVAAGDWVEITAREDHVAPLRGVVREGRKHFTTGEVVYLLSSEGEGCYGVWSKGKVDSWCDPDAAGDAQVDEEITFDPQPDPKPAGVALWVKVKTASGAEGWLRNTYNFGCTGYQDRDADCPPLPR